MCRGLFRVGPTRNVGQDLATFGDVADMSPTCRRHVELRGPGCFIRSLRSFTHSSFVQLFPIFEFDRLYLSLTHLRTLSALMPVKFLATLAKMLCDGRHKMQELPSLFGENDTVPVSQRL